MKLNREKLRSWKNFQRQPKGNNVKMVPTKVTPAVQMPTRFMPEKLVFTKYAFIKLQHLCLLGDTEISGFGVTDPDNPFKVIDFKMIKQQSSAAFTEMDNDAVRNYMEDELIARKPVRIWIHTHPGDSAHPSTTDETQLTTYFAGPNYFIMFILARGGNITCRIRVQPPGLNFYLDKEIPVTVERLLEKNRIINVADWEKEYQDTVTIPVSVVPTSYYGHIGDAYQSKATRINMVSDAEAQSLAQRMINAWENDNDNLMVEYSELWSNEYQLLSYTEQHKIDAEIQKLKKNENGSPMYRWATSTGLAIHP